MIECHVCCGEGTLPEWDHLDEAWYDEWCWSCGGTGLEYEDPDEEEVVVLSDN